MEYKYNAFISYRHTPVDARIAVEVQHRLERYTIPKGLQIEGKKRIIRIFRDKEELPTTSNLNDDILRALAQSEYLIVVCSTHTEESIWVKREIDIFLQTHPRSNIITVLAEGEPQNVIPEKLRFEERKISDKEGNETVVKAPVEPLSCDYRGNIRVARRDELPRLVATLLSVEYDQLKQRRKAYLMRRITTAALIALVLVTACAVYAIEKNIVITRQSKQIEEEYEQLVLSQSQASVIEARNAMEKNDYTTAIKQAIQAIPDDLNRFHVLPEAEKILVEVLGVYRTPFSADNTVIPTGNLKKGEVVNASIREMLLGCDGKHLLASDSDEICVLDASSLELINRIEVPGGIDVFSDDTLKKNLTELIYATGSRVYNINYVTSERQWITELDSTVIGARLINHETQVAVITQTAVEILDVKTGRRETIVPIKMSGDNGSLEINRELFASEDGSKIAFSTYTYGVDNDSDQIISNVYVVNVIAQSVFELGHELFSAKEMLFLDNDRLLVSSIRGYQVQVGSSGTVVNKSAAYLQCYDLESNTKVWEKEFPFRMLIQNVDLKEIEYQSGTDKGKAVIFSFSNRSKILDENSGKLYNDFEYNDSVLRVLCTGDMCYAYLSNGEIAWMKYNAEAIAYKQYFPDNIVSNIGMDGIIFVRTEDDDIIRYQYEKTSDRYEKKINLEDIGGFPSSFQSGCSNSGYLVALDESWHNDDNWGLNVFDQQTWQNEHIVIPTEGYSKYSISVLGFSEDEQQIYLKNEEYNNNYICVVDLDTNDVSRFPIPEEKGLQQSNILDISYLNGKVYYTGELTSTIQYQNEELTVYNQIGVFEWVPGEAPKLISTYEKYPKNVVHADSFGTSPYGEKEIYLTVPDGRELFYADTSFYINEGKNTINYILHNDLYEKVVLVTVDLRSGQEKETTLQEHGDTGYVKKCLISESGQYMLEQTSEGVTVWNQNGCKRAFEKSENSLNSLDQACFTCDEKNVVLVFDDGQVEEYDIETGKKLNDSTISSKFPIRNQDITYIPEEREEYVIIWCSDGCSVFNTNRDAFGECYYLKGCIDYNPEKDCFVFLGEEVVQLEPYQENGEIGEIQRYSVENLKEQGKAYFNLDK